MENNTITIVVPPVVHYKGSDMYIYGYKLVTTFWNDFIIAENFGIKAIKETYNRAIVEWKDNYKYLTELVMVLNWRMWHTYETNKEIAKLYEKLYFIADEYARTHLKGDELEYYYDTTD